MPLSPPPVRDYECEEGRRKGAVSYASIALNPAQREAVSYVDGPLLVFAGPGTGKTRVVAHKVAHLVSEAGYRPEQVLALTFSDSAASEMQERVERLLPGATGVRVATFHSFCNELIREHALDIGLNVGSRVITDEHQQSFLVQHLDEAGLEAFEVPTRPIELARALQSTIARLKQENVPLERLEGYLEEHRDEEGEELAKMRDVARAYRLYEGFKERRNLLDFGDMQYLAHRLLVERPDVLSDLRRRFRYIIVDEFQDTDYIQLQVLLLLAVDGNVTVVGDDDQSIYRFRGAYLTNVHEFTSFYGDRGVEVRELVLGTNYRCTGNIQTVASTLICQNPERREKEIGTEKGPGKPVLVSRYGTDWDQARGTVQHVRRLHDDGVPLEDIAVLVRRRVDSRPIIEALEQARVPFEVLGSREFFMQRVVRVAMAYLRAVHDPINNQPSVGQVMLRPVHGISPGLFQRFAAHAKDRNLTLWEALGDLATFPDDPSRLEAFRTEMEGLFEVAGEGDLQTTVRAVLFGKDLFRVEIASGSRSEVQRLNRFIELTSDFSVIYPEADLGDLIRYLEVLSDLGIEERGEEVEGGRVNLMTIHGAKGREFPYVFIPCLNKGRVPAMYRRDRIPIPPDLWDGVPSAYSDEEVHYQEERRLLYVAITRGEERVLLSTARRYGDNKRDTPESPYLAEILGGAGWEERDEVVPEDGVGAAHVDSVKSYLHHRLVGDAAHGDWRSAMGAMAAMAHLEGEDAGSLGLPFEGDIEGYLDDLRAEYEEPEALHAAGATYTPTKLATYEECPARYRYQYVLRIPDVRRTFLELGTVVHGVVEMISRKLQEGEEVQEEEALRLLDESWKSSVYSSRDKERQDREEAERMVRDFLAHRRDRPSRIVGIEEWISLDLEGRKVSGKVDRVDDTGDVLEVIDYKTSRSKLSRPQLKRDLQMVLYWEGAERLHGKPVARVGHWYLRMDEEWMVAISPEERQAALDRAKGVIESIEAGRFPATPGYRTCMYCGYADLCDNRHR